MNNVMGTMELRDCFKMVFLISKELILLFVLLSALLLQYCLFLSLFLDDWNKLVKSRE